MSPISNERAKIIEKIVKLLALAEGTNHSEEAASARRMAEELMAKYDVSLEERLKEEEIEEFDLATGKVNLDKFYTFIFNDICKFNGVFLLHRKGFSIDRKSKVSAAYHLIGRPSDREAALYMMDLVWVQVKQMLAHFRTEFHQKNGFCPLGAYHTSYMTGIVRGFGRKLDALTASVNKKRGEWGLVPLSSAVVRLNDAETWYKQDNKVRNSKQSLNVSKRSAYDQGRADGSNIQLRNGVKHTEKSQKVLS